MCGLAGISLRRGRVEEELLGRLAAALGHRGPDAETIYQHETVGLAFRRLSIIDLLGGAQPIADNTGRWRIVCNGEIYNYRALRDELIAQGTCIQTASDSEIPLHLYLTYGLRFVARLEGMYALAIHDRDTGEVVLARDPVGIKPLYLSETASGIAFSSEAGALVRAGWCAPEVHPAALPALLNRQYVGGTETLFAGITRVRPGEVVRLKEGRILERRLSPLQFARPGAMSEADALCRLDALLTQSVERHLQSEVPYGAFLSGGIDSAAIVSSMVAGGGPVRTYTVGFAESSVADERPQASVLARELDTQHTSIEFGVADFWRYLPSMCEALDDLAADYAALPTLKLADTARLDGLSVILTGEGGDEAFAGYGRYQRGGVWDTLRRRRFRQRGDTRGLEDLFQPAVLRGWRDYRGDQSDALGGVTRLQRYQARDIADWLPDDLLLKVDRCLMAHSVEGRVPFLDRQLLEFALNLPDDLKLRGNKGKYLLKRWLAARHPTLPVWAPKRGFTVPVVTWLRAKQPAIAAYLDLHDGVQSVVARDRLRSWLSARLPHHRSAKLLFTLLCYAVWHDLYVTCRELPSSLFDTSHAVRSTTRQMTSGPTLPRARQVALSPVGAGHGRAAPSPG